VTRRRLQASTAISSGQWRRDGGRRLESRTCDAHGRSMVLEGGVDASTSQITTIAIEVGRVAARNCGILGDGKRGVVAFHGRARNMSDGRRQRSRSTMRRGHGDWREEIKSNINATGRTGGFLSPRRPEERWKRAKCPRSACTPGATSAGVGLTIDEPEDSGRLETLISRGGFPGFQGARIMANNIAVLSN
jgi:hypothetical protein